MVDVKGIMLDAPILYDVVVRPLITSEAVETNLADIDGGLVFVLGNVPEERIVAALTLLRHGAGTFAGYSEHKLRLYERTAKGVWRKWQGVAKL